MATEVLRDGNVAGILMPLCSTVLIPITGNWINALLSWWDRKHLDLKSVSHHHARRRRVNARSGQNMIQHASLS